MTTLGPQTVAEWHCLNQYRCGGDFKSYDAPWYLHDADRRRREAMHSYSCKPGDFITKMDCRELSCLDI